MPGTSSMHASRFVISCSRPDMLCSNHLVRTMTIYFASASPGFSNVTARITSKIQAIAFVQVKPLQIDVDGQFSRKHQQLLRIGPPAPGAIRDARAAGQIHHDDLYSACDVLSRGMAAAIPGLGIAPDRLVGEAGQTFGRTVALPDHGTQGHGERDAKLAQQNRGGTALTAFDPPDHRPADTRARGQFIQTETGRRPQNLESVTDGFVELLLTHGKSPARAEFGSFELSMLPKNLGFPREKLNETLRRDHRRKEVVDALHGGCLLFRLLAGAGVADDNRQIARIARRPCIALDAPIEMDAGQDDGLDSLAGEFKRQLRAGKGGLQRQLVELVVTRMNQRAQLADELAVFLLHLRREV